MPSTDEIQRIATAMNAIRPDWRYTSLVTFLTNHHANRAYRDLAIAAIAVATDPRTTTPNLLNEHGPWWIASQTVVGARQTASGVPTPGSHRCPEHPHELASNCRACAVDAYNPTDRPTLTITPAQAALNADGARTARAALTTRSAS